jgi:hypothetical protein
MNVNVSPKAAGAGLGAGIGGSVATIIFGTLQMVDPRLQFSSDYVAAATTIICAVVGFLGAYIPHSNYQPSPAPNPPPPPQGA